MILSSRIKSNIPYITTKPIPVCSTLQDVSTDVLDISTIPTPLCLSSYAPSSKPNVISLAPLLWDVYLAMLSFLCVTYIAGSMHLPEKMTIERWILASWMAGLMVNTVVLVLGGYLDYLRHRMQFSMSQSHLKEFNISKNGARKTRLFFMTLYQGYNPIYFSGSITFRSISLSINLPT